MYPTFIPKDELRDMFLTAIMVFLRSPDGMTMIFEEAEKVRQELGVSKEELQRRFFIGVPA